MKITRLYTLFSLIGIVFSSAVMAEGNPAPELTTTGGRYVRVNSAAEIVDNGVYLIVRAEGLNPNYGLYAMSTKSTESQFGAVKLMDASSREDHPEYVDVETVNSSLETPYEYVFEEDTKGWMIRDIDGHYLNNNSTSSTSSMSFGEKSDKGSLFTLEAGNGYYLKLKNTFTDKKTTISGTIGMPNKSGSYFTFFSNTSDKYVVLYKKVSGGNNDDTPTTEPFEVQNVGYATLYYGEKDVTLPSGLQAFTYTLQQLGEKLYLVSSHTYNAGDKIPAGVGVVVKGAQGNYTLTLSSPDENLPRYENVLKGTDTDILLEEDAIFYMLSLNKSGELSSIGFYWGAEDGAAFTNKAHKAYLAVPKQAQAKTSVVLFAGFNDTETTGTTLKEKANAVKELQYDLLGRKIRNGGSVIRIANGKKILSR